MWEWSQLVILVDRVSVKTYNSSRNINIILNNVSFFNTSNSFLNILLLNSCLLLVDGWIGRHRGTSCWCSLPRHTSLLLTRPIKRLWRWSRGKTLARIRECSSVATLVAPSPTKIAVVAGFLFGFLLPLNELENVARALLGHRLDHQLPHDIAALNYWRCRHEESLQWCETEVMVGNPPTTQYRMIIGYQSGSNGKWLNYKSKA